jgi:predicted dehydrogenase
MNLNRREFLAAASAGAVAGVMAKQAKAQEAKKYKAVIIGDWDHGGYGHSMHLAFALRDDVQIVGLADPLDKAREKFGAEAKAERLYADWREMLAQEKPDLAVIAPRWTTNHKDYLLACAEAGCHGFMEKPLATDLAEADVMLEAVKAKNLKWAIAYNMRVQPHIEFLKAKLDEGIIGSVLEMRGRGKEDARAGGEDLVVLGTHIFDLMRYLMGADPEWCSAGITHNGKPATPADVREATEPLGPIVGNRLHAMYGFPKGTAGHFSSMIQKDGAGGRWGLDIFGSRGMITVRMDVVPSIWWMDIPSWAPAGSDKQWQRLPGVPEFAVTEEATERHKPIVDDLIAAIEEDRQPVASIDDGRWAQEMIQAVWEAHVQGCRVKLPLEKRDHPLTRISA